MSFLGLILISPLILVSCLAIWAEDKGNPIFWQERIGKDGAPFKMVKLRSMRIGAESELGSLSEKDKAEFSSAFKLKKDPRITKVGHFIRRTSIDELPQLWNVLKGDMSLVGPRPPLLIEKEAYGEHLQKVMSVKPGITGYWQVHGRSETDFGERIIMAEYYIDHMDVKLDFKILIETFGAVLCGKGAV